MNPEAPNTPRCTCGRFLFFADRSEGRIEVVLSARPCCIARLYGTAREVVQKDPGITVNGA